MPSRPFFRKVDLGVGLFIIVLALVFFLVSRQEETAAYANVYLDGALLQTVSLTEDAVFTLEEAPGVTLQVKMVKFALPLPIVRISFASMPVILLARDNTLSVYPTDSWCKLRLPPRLP